MGASSRRRPHHYCRKLIYRPTEALILKQCRTVIHFFFFLKKEAQIHKCANEFERVCTTISSKASAVEAGGGGRMGGGKGRGDRKR